MSDFEDRLRAARGYADLSQREMGARLGVHENTIKRLENGREITPFERSNWVRGYADICKLPEAFFEADFGRLAAEPAEDADGRLVRLEDMLTRIGRELREHAETTTNELRQFDDAVKTIQATAVPRDDFERAIRLITEHIQTLSEREAQ